MNVYGEKSYDRWQQMSVNVRKSGKCSEDENRDGDECGCQSTFDGRKGGDVAISLLRIMCIMIKRRKRAGETERQDGRTDYAKTARRTMTGTYVKKNKTDAMRQRFLQTRFSELRVRN